MLNTFHYGFWIIKKLNLKIHKLIKLYWNIKYLCFVSNDLVKIGESILDYIEFLMNNFLNQKY